MCYNFSREEEKGPQEGTNLVESERQKNLITKGGRPASHLYLSRKERGMIVLWESNRVPRPEIARRLHRSPSTISRELASGKGEGAAEAQKRSVLRRQAYRTLRYQDPWIQQYVQEKLCQCWFPEQIAGRLRREYPQEPTKWVSCSRIYRWLKKGF